MNMAENCNCPIIKWNNFMIVTCKATVTLEVYFFKYRYIYIYSVLNVEVDLKKAEQKLLELFFN